MKHAIWGALALVGLASCGPAPAFAQSAGCIDISVPKAEVAAHDGKWIELTPEQFQFMRGIYAMNPETPAGLPFGDKAVLATIEGNKSGLVFFIDGDKACTPMPIPAELIDMLRDVATGVVPHVGKAS